MITNYVFEKLVDGALAIIKILPDGSKGNLCDDNFYDQTARELCKRNNYSYGRRARIYAEYPFVETNLDCGWFFKKMESCDFAVPYTSLHPLAFPCSRNQGAGIYCWNENFSKSLNITLPKIKKGKLNAVLEIEVIKNTKLFRTITMDLPKNNLP